MAWSEIHHRKAAAAESGGWQQGGHLERPMQRSKGDMTRVRKRGAGRGPFALTPESPAIWELESQLMRHEAPRGGQLAEGTIPEESRPGPGGQILT